MEKQLEELLNELNPLRDEKLIKLIRIMLGRTDEPVSNAFEEMNNG